MIFLNRAARSVRIFLDNKSYKLRKFLDNQRMSWRRIESEYPISTQDKKELVKYFFEMVDCRDGPGPYIQKYNFICIDKDRKIKCFKNKPILDLSSEHWRDSTKSNASNLVAEIMLDYFMSNTSIFDKCFPVYENIEWDKSLMWLKSYL